MSNRAESPPLVIFCLDAGDADFIQRWTQEGYLPTIGSLMKRGCWGRICGPELLSTQGAWLSFFSGVSPHEHGYYYHRQLTPASYTCQRVSPQEARALPFWSHFRGGSKTIMTIDAPDTYALAGLPGLQLVNWAVQQQFNTAAVPVSAEPGHLIDDVERLAGQPIPIEVFKPHASFREDLADYRLLLKRIQQKGRVCRHYLRQEQYDLVVLAFTEAHTAGHRFWNYHLQGLPPPEKDNENTGLHHAIRDVYQAIDNELGLVMKQLPRRANIFVGSLFGMKSQYPTNGLIEAFCRQLGYQVLLQKNSGILNPLDVVRQVVPPQLRARLSRHLPLRMQEWLQVEYFRNQVDWEKTTAFSLPSLNTSFLRVNLRGREPQGIVEPGRDYENLLDQIENDLQQLVNENTGEPAIEKVTRIMRDVHHEPPVQPPVLLPDLFIEWKASSRFIERVVHPKAELVQAKPYYNRSSYHTFSGFFSVAGPSIRVCGDVGEISLLDFAPTFLSLMGQSFRESHRGAF